MKVGLSKLREQALISIELGVVHAEPFARGGFTSQRNDEIRNALAGFDEAFLSYHEARQAAKRATLEFQAIVEESLVFRKQLESAIRIATQGKASPFKDGPLRLAQTHRPALLSLWFVAVRSVVKEHREMLAEWFGRDPVELTEAVNEKLGNAIGSQRVGRIHLPVMSQKQKVARLKLAAAIARQRHFAKMIFTTNKEILREFVPIWDKKPRVPQLEAAAGQRQLPPADEAKPVKVLGPAKGDQDNEAD